MTDELIGSLDELTELDEELLGEELDIPIHAIPPNPDDCEALPSQVHPSYPYGDPTNVDHPASRPRTDGDPASRTLFVDSMYTRAATATLRWDDLALDHLLPLVKEKVKIDTAAAAREFAPGNLAQNPRVDSDEEEEDEDQG
ncbi:hypothetical protein JB92DRAFT_3110302 [Gautieria morchelliformis]|nr:hypothetical protein JB92DRAFT_3110302 [Gautieria morchelliformis]